MDVLSGRTFRKNKISAKFRQSGSVKICCVNLVRAAYIHCEPTVEVLNLVGAARGGARLHRRRMVSSQRRPRSRPCVLVLLLLGTLWLCVVVVTTVWMPRRFVPVQRFAAPSFYDAAANRTAGARCPSVFIYNRSDLDEPTLRQTGYGQRLAPEDP
eukprot:589967-Prymnesium_polylepis.1